MFEVCYTLHCAVLCCAGAVLFLYLQVPLPCPLPLKSCTHNSCFSSSHCLLPRRVRPVIASVFQDVCVRFLQERTERALARCLEDAQQLGEPMVRSLVVAGEEWGQTLGEWGITDVTYWQAVLYAMPRSRHPYPWPT